MFRRSSDSRRQQRAGTFSSSTSSFVATSSSTCASSVGFGAEELPEHFLEALVQKLALDAKRERGVLAAAPAIANVFQVCYCWKALSNSELLWENLTRSVWDYTFQRQERSRSWQQEFIHRHKIAFNFRHNKPMHYVLERDDSSGNGRPVPCRSLALSGNYLAGGFFDGTVHIFDLRTCKCVRIFWPDHSGTFGTHSHVISGIFLRDFTAVFATFYGNIFVGDVNEGCIRCVHRGTPLDEGVMVDFTGCGKFWIGMYAGIGHSLNVWNAWTMELIFRYGGMTRDVAFRGFHMWIEVERKRLGRVRVFGYNNIVAISPTRIAVLGPEPGDPAGHGRETLFGIQEEKNANLLVDSADAKGEHLLYVSTDGAVVIREVPSLAEVSTFRIEGVRDIQEEGGRILGCLGTWQAFLCINGVVHAWDVERGGHLYCLSEELGSVLDLICDDEHVAAASTDSGIHLWSFAP